MAYFGWFVLLPAAWAVAGYSFYGALRDAGLLRSEWRRPRVGYGRRGTVRRRRGLSSRRGGFS